MKGMNYKGYCAQVEFAPEDRVFTGRIIGMRDVIGFHGQSVSELEAAFPKRLIIILPPALNLARNQTNLIPAILC